jgi:hypothetical protein
VRTDAAHGASISIDRLGLHAFELEVLLAAVSKSANLAVRPRF